MSHYILVDIQFNNYLEALNQISFSFCDNLDDLDVLVQNFTNTIYNTAENSIQISKYDHKIKPGLMDI